MGNDGEKNDGEEDDNDRMMLLVVMLKMAISVM